jgi:hypothetical protein
MPPWRALTLRGFTESVRRAHHVLLGPFATYCSAARSLDPVHGRVAGDLDLDPVVAATRAVGSIAAFRHHALQSHAAGCAEEIRSDLRHPGQLLRIPFKDLPLSDTKVKLGRDRAGPGPIND